MLPPCDVTRFNVSQCKKSNMAAVWIWSTLYNSGLVLQGPWVGAFLDIFWGFCLYRPYSHRGHVGFFALRSIVTRDVTGRQHCIDFNETWRRWEYGLLTLLYRISIHINKSASSSTIFLLNWLEFKSMGPQLSSAVNQPVTGSTLIQSPPPAVYKGLSFPIDHIPTAAMFHWSQCNAANPWRHRLQYNASQCKKSNMAAVEIGSITVDMLLLVNNFWGVAQRRVDWQMLSNSNISIL